MLLHNTVQQDVFSVVRAGFQISRGELDLFRLDPFFRSRAQQLAEGCLHGEAEVLEASAAFEPQDCADFALNEHLSGLSPHREMPLGRFLDSETVKPFPSAVFASDLEAHTRLRDVGTL